MIGTNFRFFSNRVFGVWVDGTVRSVGSKYMKIDAYFQGNDWVERRPVDMEVYYPSGHQMAGEAFKVSDLA